MDGPRGRPATQETQLNPMQLSAPPASRWLARAHTFQRDIDRALATSVEETQWGLAVYHDGFPRVTDVNVLLVDSDAGGFDGPELMREADRFQGGLPHRAIRVDDPQLAARIAPTFAAAGWTVDRTALMFLRRAPDRPLDTSMVSEVPLESIRGAREAAMCRIHRDLDVAAEAVAVGALQSDVAPVRAYAALVSGEVAAYCLLRTGEGGAKLVEVQALARSQGHGVGRATIRATALAARNEGRVPVFVECEDEEWAKSVYRRLGFDEAGKVHRLIRAW